jgi:hypothetical protein
MRARTLLFVAAAAALVTRPLAAQYDDDYGRYDYDLPRSYVGGELTYAHPQGQFANYIDQGWGAGVHYLVRLDQSGWLGLRADAGLVNYGHERQEVLLSPTIGGRVPVDLTTDNNILFLGAGPQIGLPTGALRPYANGFVGVSYIFTESKVGSTRSGESFAEHTNFDDASFAYGGSAGLYIPVSRRANPVSIDLGVTYRHNGTAEYLRHGDITDNPDGSITLHPVRSETNLINFHLGVSVGVR